MLEQLRSMFMIKYITAIFNTENIISNFVDYLRSIYIVMKSSEFYLPISKIKANEKDECVVMGNGPSLNDVLINNSVFFEGKKKVCVNQFARSREFEKIQPEYYVFLDPAYWEKTASQNTERIILALCAIMKEKVTWRMKIFMPVQARKWNAFAELPQLNVNIEIFYFNTTEVTCIKPLKYCFFRNGLAMPPAQNVLVAGIFLALNIGFKKIYVLGADHSWHESIYIDDNNDLYCMEAHCYESTAPVLIPFYKDSAETDRFKLHELFAALSRKFEGYIILEDFANDVGSKVYNASNKSFIDAFERYKIGNG